MELMVPMFAGAIDSDDNTMTCPGCGTRALSKGANAPLRSDQRCARRTGSQLLAVMA
jgi:tRNA(Ile2) C34 agmatinyltransferase TiaS